MGIQVAHISTELDLYAIRIFHIWLSLGQSCEISKTIQLVIDIELDIANAVVAGKI